MSCYIYKHLDKNMDVIYVGQTIDMNSRQTSHKNNSEWSKEIVKVEFAEVYDKTMMDIMERYYISKYKPRYNKDFNDCDYYEYFDIKKELYFIEYKKDKTRSLNFHRKDKLVYCSEISSINENKNYNNITSYHMECIRTEFDKSINKGTVDKSKFINIENEIDLLRKNYKIKFNEIGLKYFNYKTTYGVLKVCKFIYDFEYLKQIYFNSLCLELKSDNFRYINFTDLINNKLLEYRSSTLGFTAISKTPIANIKSDVPIHNTEYLHFIEEHAEYYLGFIYGICFKIDKKYIIDISAVEPIEYIDDIFEDLFGEGDSKFEYIL